MDLDLDLNLDEARAARDEVEGAESFGVVFKGERFVLPSRLPIALLEHLTAYLVKTQGGKVIAETDEERKAMGDAVEELLKGCEVLMGAEAWARFKGHGADLSDVLALLTGVMRKFKVGENGSAGTPADALGESDSSGSPSSDSGASLRPTGDGTTEATSVENSTEDDSLSDVSAS